MSELAIKETDLNLGHEIYLRWIFSDNERCGAFIIHPGKPGGEFERCWSHVRFAPDGKDVPGFWGFNFDYEKPTFTPSVLCLSCGCHGFIRDGKWIPA